MAYMTRYDATNTVQFRTGRQNGYLCSMCGQYTSLSDSVSHQGYNLVCMRCVYKIGAILNDTSIGDLIMVIHEKGKHTELLETKSQERGDKE